MPRFSVGIDLGTTHSALSHLDLEAAVGRGREQSILPVPQLIQPGVVDARPLLPSFLYLPSPAEFAVGALDLPWSAASTPIVGEFARAHGAKSPTRLVASAKSWLCHPGVDRRAPLLPWQAPAEVAKVSPLEAAHACLAHLRAAWNHHHGAGEAPLEAQEIVLTVPASFDAAARDLTVEAAKLAGLDRVTLLEEPQAAFYAWIEAMGAGFRKALRPGEVVLVVDVGGGTTDFSLIEAREAGGELELARLAVGDHILLGGDNMDLALAHTLSQRLATQGKKLDAWQFHSLTQACRSAKETLFADPALPSAPVVVPSRGSALIGGSVKTTLERADLESILVEGFLPKATVADAPVSTRGSGLAQMSLPYAKDAAVTRHLAQFLRRQASATPGGAADFARPTAILFNGGVFKAGVLRQRLLEVLNGWLEGAGAPPARVLEGCDLDLSVARGAAYYGWVRQGHGVRIRGGTARAYYVGVESSMPAVPGFEPPIQALCVAPLGMEEGTRAEIPPQEFGLVVGEPTRFRFFTSSTRRDDQAGVMVEDAAHAEDLEELAPIETSLPAGDDPAGELVPVNIQAAITELGTLELRCLQRNGAGNWKLELNVRMRD